MEETADELTLPQRTQLLKCIADCIEHSVTQQIQIVREHLLQSLRRAQSIVCEEPILNALINLLQNDNTMIKVQTISFIYELRIINPSMALITSIASELHSGSKDVRECMFSSRRAGEKAVTNEMITQLVNALADENKHVRRSATSALGKIGEKTATNEVINQLVSALGDKSAYVRESACLALGKMGEKAATNEVITQLVSALGDENGIVRRNACSALGKMGEKAVTNEVISKLVIPVDNDIWWFDERTIALTNILRSCVVIQQLNPKVVSNICLSEWGLHYLTNISADEFINIFLTTKNSDWLLPTNEFMLLKGFAIVVVENRIVMYCEKEPLEMPVSDPQLLQWLVEAFTYEAQQLHLDMDVPSKT